MNESIVSQRPFNTSLDMYQQSLFNNENILNFPFKKSPVKNIPLENLINKLEREYIDNSYISMVSNEESTIIENTMLSEKDLIEESLFEEQLGHISLDIEDVNENNKAIEEQILDCIFVSSMSLTYNTVGKVKIFGIMIKK